MKIRSTPEQVYHLTPQISVEVAQDRIEQNKMNLIAGKIGKLFSRLKSDDIEFVELENRLEPFWWIKASSRVVFDREEVYAIPTRGPEVQSVTLADLKRNKTPALTRYDGQAPILSLEAVEHCVQEIQTNRTYDGLDGNHDDVFKKFLNSEKELIEDLDDFAPEDTLIAMPKQSAKAVVSKAIDAVFKPVERAKKIREEVIEIEQIELYLRPVYAFEYASSSKQTKFIIEFDAILGDINQDGKRISDFVKGALSSELLLDIAADSAEYIIPGGRIITKIVTSTVKQLKK